MTKRRSGGGGSRSGGKSSGGKSSGGKGTTPTKRIVQQRPAGDWEVVAPRAERASAIESTQAKAKKRATEIVKNEGGGEVVIKDKNGKIRDSDTVAPGKDPRRPKDKKH